MHSRDETDLEHQAIVLSFSLQRRALRTWRSFAYEGSMFSEVSSHGLSKMMTRHRPQDDRREELWSGAMMVSPMSQIKHKPCT